MAKNSFVAEVTFKITVKNMLLSSFQLEKEVNHYHVNFYINMANVLILRGYLMEDWHQEIWIKLLTKTK